MVAGVGQRLKLADQAGQLRFHLAIARPRMRNAGAALRKASQTMADIGEQLQLVGLIARQQGSHFHNPAHLGELFVTLLEGLENDRRRRQ